MEASPYDVAIVGGGPIGASSAYFLSQDTNKKILLITQDPTDDHTATYNYAGGSIRWFWDDELRREMTSTTAEFIKHLLKEGVDLSAIEDSYLFLKRGVMAPSLNVSSAKLVNYFIMQATGRGLTLQGGTVLHSVAKEGGVYNLKTDKGIFTAKKVVLALGTVNKKFVDLDLEVEKRQLFVLNVPVDEYRKNFPHLIFPFHDGVVFVFVKNIKGEYKIVLGQEDVVEHNDAWEAEDYFQKLLELGLADTLTFLKDAKPENILWGFDVKQKTVSIVTQDSQLYAVNCGSAVRSCVYIGKKIAEMLA